ncbi:K+ channel protein [Chondrocystis sp. NIES-4102]|nr:K+ channel protein [Chondrocystis sp. NIES-4102]
MLPSSGSRRKKRRHKKLKINFNNGRLEAPNINKWQTHWREPYYLMLTRARVTEATGFHIS